MQTFLPYPDFQKTAQCLDMRRLGKQRVEAYQLLNILLKRTEKQAWKNHPACLMWEGYEEALKEYFNTMCIEWVSRGYKNNMLPEIVLQPVTYPWWFGNEELHTSHRSNLLRKKPEHYSKFGWVEPNDLPYHWPVRKDNYIQNGNPRPNAT